MTDDIVTRLREHCDTSHIPDLPCDWLGTKCFNCESADEIERLQKENAEWKELINHPVWATPPRMTCTKHGIKYLSFDDFMGGVYWCEGCKYDG